MLVLTNELPIYRFEPSFGVMEAEGRHVRNYTSPLFSVNLLLCDPDIRAEGGIRALAQILAAG